MNRALLLSTAVPILSAFLIRCARAYVRHRERRDRYIPAWQLREFCITPKFNNGGPYEQ